MTNSETVSVERLDELQDALNEGRILSVLMESDLAAMLSALRTQPAQPVNEPGEWQVEAACKSFIYRWDACTDEVKQDCRRDMREALRAASIPAEAQGREPMAYIDAQGGVLMTAAGEAWFKAIKDSIVPFGLPVAPLYATPPASERSKEEVGNDERLNLHKKIMGMIRDKQRYAGAMIGGRDLHVIAEALLDRAIETERAALEPASLHKGEALPERCPHCSLHWGYNPPAIVAGTDQVRCIECKTLYASPAPLPVTITATHRHKKRGTVYVLIGIGKMQAEHWRELVGEQDLAEGDEVGSPVDMREVAVYRSATDPTEIWVRPREEFEDGRFEALSVKPSGEEG